MKESEIQRLQEELDQFKKEKEKVKMIIGGIGGQHIQTKDRVVNILFIILIVLLFIIDFARHVLHYHVPLPPLLTIELGVMIVSIKIIWMMHKQMKVEHFQFWILSSIEYRINDISKKVTAIEKKLDR